MCNLNKFGINLKLVINYLDVKKKENFISRFKLKFKENIDYIIITEEEKRKKIKNCEFIKYMIILDTFENICLVSHTKIGNEVREYFITLRKFIQYYKNNLDKMIKYSKCYVYVILVDKGKNIYKLGRTCDFRKRLSTYATGKINDPNIKYILQVKNPIDIENCSKLLLQKYNYKKGKELYKVDFDIIRSIIVDCAIAINNRNNIENIKNNKKMKWI